MSKRQGKQTFGANMAKIADEGRQVVVKPQPELVAETTPAIDQQEEPAVPDRVTEDESETIDEAATTQPHEAAEPEDHEAVVAKPQKAAKAIPLKRTSTSLYLSPAAHRVLRIHAAKLGVRSNRIYEDALRDYFEKESLGNFDKINKTAP